MAETLRRGVYTTGDVPVLVTPTPDQVVAVNGLNKAAYFSTIGDAPIFVASELTGSTRPEALTSPTFLTHTVRPLTDRIRRDLKLRYGDAVPERVSVRGTAVSLTGRVEVDDIDANPRVFDSLAEILSLGTDRGGNPVLAESPFVNDDQILSYDALRYTQFHARQLRSMLEMVGMPSDGVFPLVLVFDPKYARGLVVTPPADQPGEAILNAYVLDYPVR